jgi:hypothetical protein
LKEFSQAAPCHEGENRKRDLLRYFADTTLRLWQFKVPLSKRIFDGCASERPTGVHGRIDSPLILLVTYESVAMLFR